MSAAYADRLDIPGTSNARDLGGCPITGGRLAPGRLLRSEALAHPGASEVHAIWDDTNTDLLRGLGLRTVVDLRTPQEHLDAPSAWHEATGAEVISLPIPEGGAGSDTDVMEELLGGRRAGFSDVDMGHLYVATLERRAGVLGSVVKLLAEPSRLPLLVHCSAGKDRTGLTVALVLGALGTPRELVVRDYTLTGQHRPARVDLYADTFAAVGLTTDDVRALFETPAIAMEMALDHLDAAYGGVTAYLLDAGGVSPDELDAMRHNLTEATS